MDNKMAIGIWIWIWGKFFKQVPSAACLEFQQMLVWFQFYTLICCIHFPPKLGVEPAFLDVGLSKSIFVGVSLDTDIVYIDCIISIEDRKLLVDLVLLDLKDFDVILGMDWLAAYHASMDCFYMTIVLHDHCVYTIRTNFF